MDQSLLVKPISKSIIQKEEQKNEVTTNPVEFSILIAEKDIYVDPEKVPEFEEDEDGFSQSSIPDIFKKEDKQILDQPIDYTPHFGVQTKFP